MISHVMAKVFSWPIKWGKNTGKGVRGMQWCGPDLLLEGTGQGEWRFESEKLVALKEHLPRWRLDIGPQKVPWPHALCEDHYPSPENRYLALTMPEPHVLHPSKTSSSPSAGRNPWRECTLSLPCGVPPPWILPLCFADLPPPRAKGPLTGCLEEAAGTRPVNT